MPVAVVLLLVPGAAAIKTGNELDTIYNYNVIKIQIQS